MTSAVIISLDIRQYNISKHRDYTSCQKCGIKFKKPAKKKPYDIVTKRNGNKTKRYHVECARIGNLL